MNHIKCHKCKLDMYFTIIDEEEFNKRFIIGNEPIYCPDCWEKREKEKEKNK